MGDRLQASIPPQYVTKPTRSTQPCPHWQGIWWSVLTPQRVWADPGCQTYFGALYRHKFAPC